MLDVAAAKLAAWAAQVPAATPVRLAMPPFRTYVQILISRTAILENWNDDNFNTNDPSSEFQGGNVRGATGPSGIDNGDQLYKGNTTDVGTVGAGGNQFGNTGRGASGGGAGAGGDYGRGDTFGRGDDFGGSGRAPGQDFSSSGRDFGGSTGASGGQDWDDSNRTGGGRTGGAGAYSGNTTDYDTSGTGTPGGGNSGNSGAGGKVSMGDKVKGKSSSIPGLVFGLELTLFDWVGTMEKVAGKVSGNQGMSERGQERKVP